MQYKDYYAILGVSHDAKPEDIRKAYRKLAKQYHPDVNKSPGAEAKYQEINEAYEVLKDSTKRERYDTLGQNWQGGQDFTPPSGWRHVDFGGASGFGNGASGFSEFFQTLFGNGHFQDIFSGNANMRHDTHAELTLTLEQVIKGGEFALSLNNRTINVRLPRGITDGSQIKLPGQADNGGDILVNIHLAPHNIFSVSGQDLTRDIHVKVWDAVLGKEISVETLDGKVNVKMPAGIQDGQKLRLRGKGLPGRNGDNGDMYVRIRIDIPTRLNSKQNELWQELARMG